MSVSSASPTHPGSPHARRGAEDPNRAIREPREDVAGRSQQDEHAPRPGPAFPIVGIGASAGGLEALEALFRRTSADGMAFVVVQHLSPSHPSLLGDILARDTSLNVVAARNGSVVEPNTIYVSPPNAELSLRHGVLRVAPASGDAMHHPIDAFFRTVASDAGPMGIGVVLSGAGTDGTLGLRAIKEGGGITFVQEPGTASQPSMPRSAIDAGAPDACLSPAEIGDELMRLAAHPYVARKRLPRRFAPELLRRLFDRLRRSSGVDFSVYKPGTVERRIERRMALRKLDRLEDYLAFLDARADELNALFGDLRVGVTGFFRDRDPFEALTTTVFPRLVASHGADVPIRIWVPGCSTGEEVYSIAMCLAEYLDSHPSSRTVQIFGTDIDEHALARARRACFSRSIEVDVSPERLQRFFRRYDGDYQVSRQLREHFMFLFPRHDLGKDPPFSRIDLISCRNVLIYMEASLQRKVLRALHYALNPDGCLLLGSSESVGDASDLFSLLDPKVKIYRKKNESLAAAFDVGSQPHPPPAERRTAAQAWSAVEDRPLTSMQQLADHKVLEKFGPPGVLVDEDMDVIQFRGHTGRFLGPSPGAATLNVMKLVRPELLVPLRTTLSRAAKEGRPQVSPPVAPGGDNAAAVVVEVTPIVQALPGRRCFLVLFREAPAPVAPERSPESAEPEAEARQPRVQELERELLVTRDSLQRTVQKLRASNEALQSTNEELQSANEELLSTNEAVETGRAELVSTNEELVTVNQELEKRMVQLSAANDDLHNVMEGVSAPFVIVGMDVRIRHFSAEAARLLDLVPGDVGRPIGYLGAALNAPQLEAVVSATINTARERGRRVRCSDGRWYTARVIPYRTAEHAIHGAFIEFLRAPPQRGLGQVPEVHELVGKVLSTLPHVLMVLDEELRIVWVNKAFFETFVMGAEVLGRSLDEVWPGRTAHPELWQAFEETVAGGKSFAEIWVSHPFGRQDGRPMKFAARCIPAEGNRPALTLVEMEESSGGRAS